MKERVAGLFGAPITPVDSEGRADTRAFERVIDYLLSHGIEGICVGGATGEYPHFELATRKALVEAGARAILGRGRFLVSVGAPTFRGVVELAGHAVAQGAEALLLPAPYFFRYDQGDLEEYCRQVCRAVPADYMLYNLPNFTNPYEVGTSIRILESEERVVGIKDSSGNRAAVDAFLQARGTRSWSLMVGNDGLVLDALLAGWDGTISGACNVCPELYSAMWRCFRSGDREGARLCMNEIDSIRKYTTALPVPWMIRLAVGMRGIPVGPIHLPVSPARMERIAEFEAWFRPWLAEKIPSLIEQVSSR